jgi:hypothetical protein
MQSTYLGDRVRLLVLVVMSGLAPSSLGCGNVNEGSPLDAAPGPSIDAAPADSAVVPPRCDPNKPFGAPTPVPNINSISRDQGAVLVDNLALYFGSDRAGGAGGTDIYVATRSSPTSPFSAPVSLSFNKSGSESGPTLTGDGLTMFYISTPSGGTGDIYVTKRDNKTSAFTVSTLVDQINMPSVEDLDPFITADGTILYFDSARNGTALHLYMAVRQGNAPFGLPQPLMTLNTTAIDGHPVVSQDGLRIYWSSTRADGGAKGLTTDIWTAVRSSTAGMFDTATRVPELSSDSNESPSWIAPDGCSIYLQSDRAGTMGAQDIFEAVKPM